MFVRDLKSERPIVDLVLQVSSRRCSQIPSLNGQAVGINST
jgi:hypothetical protein